MTRTCRYRKRGKVCRKAAIVTLLGYSVTFPSRKASRVVGDNSVRQAYSYCTACAGLIARRVNTIQFVPNIWLEGPTRADPVPIIDERHLHRKGPK